MPSSSAFETHLADAWPVGEWSEVTTLVAVSGGADSIALLRAMARLKTGGVGRLIAVHFNHRLRPESDADARFVEDLCRESTLPCEIGSAEPHAIVAEAADGIEAAARAARYAYLQQTAERLGARFVVTAHTADDQAETILHRIVRGTGIRGLAGMARSRRLGHATLIRPMLTLRRSQVVEYLKSLGQPWREDSSNTNTQFTRNRIRCDVLPLLREQFNPEVSDALLRLGRLAGEAQQEIDKLVDNLLEDAVRFESDRRVCVRLDALANQTPYLVRELLTAVWQQQAWPLQAMNCMKWEELSRMVQRGSLVRKQAFPGGIMAEIVQGQLCLHQENEM